MGLRIRNSLIITDFAHYAVRIFLLERAYCSGFESMSAAEKHTDIAVRTRLVITGKIQIDIRLFVTIESKKGLERNVLPVYIHNLAAVRTLLLRHIVT